MSRLHSPPLWTSHPQIPIYLETSDNQERRLSTEGTEYTCPTCEISSRDQPIHCVSHSTHASPAPPPYRSVALNTQPSRLAVPTLNVVTTQNDTNPEPPRRVLQFDPEGRPTLRFRRNAFSPLSPTPAAESETLEWGDRKSSIGLGIPDAQFRPDASPITPGTAEKRGDGQSEDLQGASNFAQRIEQKLWKYSASGNVVKRWLIEIISWVLSAVCMLGIIGMLFYYKDKNIPKWPLGLTLNAYISVLSKVASAALLLPVSEALGQLKWSWFQGDNSKKMWDFEIFDNASRGPWGSMLLLVRTKGKSLAALGAAVTLFALALDPFFQQVVEYPERWRLQEDSGSIPRAISYAPYLGGTEYRMQAENIEMDQRMMGIAFNYFYDKGTKPINFGKGVRAEVPLACPSSNCTWPPYETVGMSSKCVPAQEKVEFGCRWGKLNWVATPTVDEDGAFFPNGTSCGWWLKAEKQILMTGYNVDPEGSHRHVGEILMERAQPYYDVNMRDMLPGYKPLINDTRNPIYHVIISTGESIDKIHQNSTPVVHECTLSWSLKTVSSSYSEGGYHETILKNIVNGTTGAWPWIITELKHEKASLSGIDYRYAENITIVGDSGQVYQVDNKTHVLTLALFDDVYPSVYTVVNSTDESDAMLRYKQYADLNPYSRNMSYNPYMYPNISDHLDKMSVAITNLIRSSTKTEDVTGPAYDQETFVQVRWPWLTLPLGLLVFTFIFLILTIIRSSLEQDQVGVWKTSAIATLLYGLPDAMQKKITASEANGTPRAKAKEIKLKWLPKAGWRFSGNSHLSPLTPKFRRTVSDTASIIKPGNSSTVKFDTASIVNSDTASIVNSDTSSILKPNFRLSPPSPQLSATTLIPSTAPSLKSAWSSPSIQSLKSSSSSMTSPPSPPSKSPPASPFEPSFPTPPAKSPPTSPFEPSFPTPPAKPPPASPFEPSFPTPPLGSVTPSPPFASFNHPSPLASNPSHPLDSPRNTQTYYEANPHAYYQTDLPAMPQPSPEPNPQANHRPSTPPKNAQRHHRASPPANSERKNPTSSLVNPWTIPGVSSPAGSPPPLIPFVRTHARRPSKPRYPTPPPGWI